MSKTVVTKHTKNFETLRSAFLKGDVALLDCVLQSSKEHVAVICATHPEGDQVAFTPLAMFFNGDPYELLSPPIEYDNQDPKK